MGVTDMRTVRCEGAAPTEHPASFHGRTDISLAAQRNRCLRLGLMTAAGWTHHPYEWWHYNLPEPTRYPKLSDEVEGGALLA